MSRANIATRIAQVGDGIPALLSRMRAGPLSGVALASAARTVSTQSADIDTAGFRGLAVWLNCTVAGASGGITLYLLTKDPASGLWATNYAILPTVSTVRMSSCLLGPGISVGSNVNIVTGNADRGIILPSNVRFYAVASDASSYTYSLAYELIP